MVHQANKNHFEGFTLIEVLVTVAIISMLSSVTITSVSSNRMKAQHTKYVGELKDVVTGLGLYVLDGNQLPQCFNVPGCYQNDQQYDFGLDALLQPVIDKGYIKKFPHHATWGPGIFREVFTYYEPTLNAPPYSYPAALICGRVTKAEWDANRASYPGALIIHNYTGVPVPGVAKEYTSCSAHPTLGGCSTYEVEGCINLLY